MSGPSAGAGPSIEEILAEAEALAASRHHEELQPVHLAAAWQRLDRTSAQALLGPEVAGAVARLLDQVPWGPQPPRATTETTELLAWVQVRTTGTIRTGGPWAGEDDSRVELLERLAQGLRNLLDLDEPASTGTSDRAGPVDDEGRAESADVALPPRPLPPPPVPPPAPRRRRTDAERRRRRAEPSADVDATSVPPRASGASDGDGTGSDPPGAPAEASASDGDGPVGSAPSAGADEAGTREQEHDTGSRGPSVPPWPGRNPQPEGDPAATAVGGDADGSGAERLIRSRPGGLPVPDAEPAEVGEVLQTVPEVVRGLDEVVDRMVEAVRRHAPTTPCLVAPRGAGRTTALRVLSQRLGDGSDDSAVVVRARAEVLLGAGRGADLRTLRDGVMGGNVLALDDLETLLMLGTSSVDADLRSVVRALIANPEVRTVATVDEALLGTLRSVEPELASHLDVIELPVRGGEDLRAIGEDVAATLATHHEVAIRAGAVDAAAEPAPPESPLAHPGLLADRLDRACARARRRGAEVVEAADVEVRAGGPDWPAVDASALAGRLRRRIVGQDDAVERVSRRLALTSVGLDLRPDRPNGAFLLVGPSGVGKTALALALAEELFGSVEHVVRLDMSELADESALNRLVGPNPGYLGSDRPEGWFTSRVRKRPISVVLVDEVEKAHPTVWNAFLQVLDEGRLTDSTGVPVSFSDTVVVLTSNIGSRSFDANPLGFGAASGAADAAVDRAEAEVGGELARTMPPELVNRLDDVLVFRPLTPEAIAEICALEVGRLVGSLADRGWRIELGDDVLRLLAEDGYEPAFGARHLQRSIERHVLETLVGLEPGEWTASVDPATASIRWAPA